MPIVSPSTALASFHQDPLPEDRLKSCKEGCVCHPSLQGRTPNGVLAGAILYLCWAQTLGGGGGTSIPSFFVLAPCLCFWSRALQESLLANSRASPQTAGAPPLRDSSSFERDLQLALELSVHEQQQSEQRRREEEEADLQQALQLSLVEK